MRGLTHVTCLLLLVAAPTANAGGSAIALSGPSSVTFADPVTVPVRAHVLFDGIVCREETHVPVTLRVTRASGATASFEADHFLARIPAGASVSPREASATLMLRLAPVVQGAGVVELAGSFQLPRECVATDGASRGEDTLLIALHVTAANDAPVVQEDLTRPIELRPEVPGGIIAASAAALCGAVLVTLRRVREWRARAA